MSYEDSFFENLIKNGDRKFILTALLKQTPQKPIERHSKKWGNSYNDGECPICNAVYSDGLSETPLYCSQCGQKFDWSDKE